MAFDSFSEFIRHLDKAGQLLTVNTPVATELEITELADRQMKSPEGGKALLISKPTVNGTISPYPVVINAFGSWDRMAMVFGAESVGVVADELGALLGAKPPMSFREALNLFRSALDLRHARPKTVNDGPCNEIVHRFERRQAGDPVTRSTVQQCQTGLPVQHFNGSTKQCPTLLDMPILKCWPLDAGRFITLPCVVTRDPDTGVRNVGMYRMQIYDGCSTGMHWQTQKTGARHWRAYVSKGLRMPVAVFIGGDPIYSFAAAAPLPDGLDEFQFAGYLRKRPVELVKCQTNDLEVPAHADFVIEGYIDPTEPLRDEGPFGDHTGFYTAPEPYPVLHVTAITHRKDAVYPTTIVGKPPMEDFYIGNAALKLFMPLLRLVIPELVEVALPAEGVFHNFMFVSIRKTYPMQAFKVMYALWGMGQMMFTKYIVVVDDDVDVQNTSEVLFRLGANTDPKRDMVFTKGPADALDHATTEIGVGTKVGIDATRKLPGEGFNRPWPEMIRMDEAVKMKIEAFFAGGNAPL